MNGNRPYVFSHHYQGILPLAVTSPKCSTLMEDWCEIGTCCVSAWTLTWKALCALRCKAEQRRIWASRQALCDPRSGACVRRKFGAEYFNGDLRTIHTYSLRGKCSCKILSLPYASLSESCQVKTESHIWRRDELGHVSSGRKLVLNGKEGHALMWALQDAWDRGQGIGRVWYLGYLFNLPGCVGSCQLIPTLASLYSKWNWLG